MKKTFKAVTVTAASLLVLLLLIVAFLLNFILTPAKLTPVAVEAANRSLNADVRVSRVEVTFFSTFPNFGIRLDSGSVVARCPDGTSAPASGDTLVSFDRAVAVFNPLDLVFRNRISVRRILLFRPRIYAYVDTAGRANWNIALSDSLSVPEAPADTARSAFDASVDVRSIRIRKGRVVFDDRAHGLYARLEDVSLKLRGALSRTVSDLDMGFTAGNIILWRQGDLLLNRLALGIEAKARMDRAGRKLGLDRAVVDVNGLKLGAGGILQGDTARKALQVDIRYGLHVPSLATVLDLVPEAVIPRGKRADTSGEVLFTGAVCGLYSKTALPVVTGELKIEKASARYKGMPYGIESLDTEASFRFDLGKDGDSYVKVNRFRFRGSESTELDLTLDVRRPMTDPRLGFTLRSDMDFGALTRIFPLREGLELSGKFDSDVRGTASVEDVRRGNIGSVVLDGTVRVHDVRLKADIPRLRIRSSVAMKNGEFHLGKVSREKGKAGDGRLGGLVTSHIVFNGMSFRQDSVIDVSIDNVTLDTEGELSSDTARVAPLDVKMGFSGLKLNLGDTVFAFLAKSRISARLRGDGEEPRRASVAGNLETDSLFFKAFGNRLALEKAGFDLTALAPRHKGRAWRTGGVVGFHNLRFRSDRFRLPVRVASTRVSFSNRQLSLDRAQVMVGSSDLLTTGHIDNFMRTLLGKSRTVSGDLNVSSNLLNLNELIAAVNELPAEAPPVCDTLGLQDMRISADTPAADTVPDSLSVFVVPSWLDFRFEARLKKVLLEKAVLENVEGDIHVGGGEVKLSHLTMEAAGADVRTHALYHAPSITDARAGFDLRIRRIDVARLIGFMPSLDTLLPMLRSFEGIVDFDIAAESPLRPDLQIDPDSLRAAVYIRGDSLVLLDGETFAEISKMLMFKNKKRNLIDSVSVNILVEDGAILVYPFRVEMDRYRVAVGGEHKMDMNFNYHISILKSPVPFKLGLDVRGNPDKFKFRLAKARYKKLDMPARVEMIDSMSLVIRRRMKF